jgi:anti-anti-sigma factor
MSSGESTVPGHATTVVAIPAATQGTSTLSVAAAGPNVSVVSVSGTLTGTDAAEHLAAVLQYERARGCRLVRLDVSSLSILDREAFEVVVDAHERFRAIGGALVVTGATPRVARLIELTGLGAELFAITDSGEVSRGPAESLAARGRGAR